MERIHELRERIDEIDEDIIELIDKRVEVAKEIGEIKQENDLSITDHDRERKVLERTDEYRDIFKKIIERCKKEQR